jgi:RNA polymerase sigma-70 factor, ECF subfamily
MADARSWADKAGKMAELVAEHHQAVYRYAYRLAGTVQNAEDLTQQVYLVAQRKIDQLRNMDSARTWLFTILRNCYVRDRQKRWPSLAADLSMNMDFVPTSTPSDDADFDQLQHALNQLPDAARLVVVMFYFEECSYREIAERLDVPVGTVMSRLARARDYLRALLLEAESSRRKRRSSVAAE